MATSYRHPYCMEVEQDVLKVTIRCGISRAKYKIYGIITIQNIVRISYKVLKCYTKSVICSNWYDYELFWNIRNASTEWKQSVFEHILMLLWIELSHPSDLLVCVLNVLRILLKTCKVCNCSVKVVFIPCINTVYRLIYSKLRLIRLL
jgi:hypothetical protein